MNAGTIFALASAPGTAAIAVLRLSGPATGAILAALAGTLPPPRQARLRSLRNREGAALDQALVLWFPAPASYTGEDAAELHLHGGRAVLEGVTAALLALGARPAEPGEFTRRAFAHGRLDLTEAEAVADLIAAETEAQRAQALRQLSGALGELYGAWSARLTTLLAQAEALIDFPDEDIPAETESAAAAETAALAAEIASHLNDSHRGERLRDGLVFAIAGPPNAGKSTLVNALAGREVAIVSPHPGTTRDVLEARLDLGGVPVTLLDTAGLRDSTDAIEAEGIRRARARMAQADLVIYLLGDEAEAPQAGALLVHPKCDLSPAAPDGALAVSAVTGAGMDRLAAHLAEIARILTGSAGSPPLTRARHRAALEEARSSLTAAGLAPLPELRGEDLRLALRALGRITGTVAVEDILDSVFSQFCIGK